MALAVASNAASVTASSATTVTITTDDEPGLRGGAEGGGGSCGGGAGGEGGGGHEVPKTMSSKSRVYVPQLAGAHMPQLTTSLTEPTDELIVFVPVLIFHAESVVPEAAVNSCVVPGPPPEQVAP